MLAGVNGAGKSSLSGAAFLAEDVEFFNPDEAARTIQEAKPGLPGEAAQSAAWALGVRLLRRSIAEGLDYAFETTLGGKTIAGLLEGALDHGAEVRVWFVGLADPELHLQRIRARVERGGHDIPEQRVRDRYRSSREHLIELLPRLTELIVFDNSEERDPALRQAPQPRLILHMLGRQLVAMAGAEEVPEWAKPIVMAATRAASGKS